MQQRLHLDSHHASLLLGFTACRHVEGPSLGMSLIQPSASLRQYTAGKNRALGHFPADGDLFSFKKRIDSRQRLKSHLWLRRVSACTERPARVLVCIVSETWGHTCALRVLVSLHRKWGIALCIKSEAFS